MPPPSPRSCLLRRPRSAGKWKIQANRTGMNKRLAKRHKRQVARAKVRLKLSEPDVRTPEQLAAAREASRSMSGLRSSPRAYYSAPPSNPAGAPADVPAKVET